MVLIRLFNKIIFELVSLQPNKLDAKIILNNLHELVQEDPPLTIRLLTGLARYRPDIFTETLLKLADSIQLTVNSLEVVYGISLLVVIDQAFLDAYVAKWFHNCTDLDTAPKKRNIRLICRFIMELIKKGIFDISKRKDLWLHYCTFFDTFGNIKDFKDLLMRSGK